jgi:hypothetical protein
MLPVGFVARLPIAFPEFNPMTIHLSTDFAVTSAFA